MDDQGACRVQVYVRIRPLGKGDVKRTEGKSAVNVDDEDQKKVENLLINPTTFLSRWALLTRHKHFTFLNGC